MSPSGNIVFILLNIFFALYFFQKLFMLSADSNSSLVTIKCWHLVQLVFKWRFFPEYTTRPVTTTPLPFNSSLNISNSILISVIQWLISSFKRVSEATRMVTSTLHEALKISSLLLLSWILLISSTSCKWGFEIP